MTVPGFKHFLRPVLEIIAEHKRLENARPTVRSLTIKKMKFNDDEISEQLSSGGNRIANRTGWALTYLSKACLIKFPARGLVEITDEGISFLKEHKGPISPKDLTRFEAFNSFKNSSTKPQVRDAVEAVPDERDPEDRIDQAVLEIRDEVASILLNRLRSIDPYYFEAVVLDVMKNMGYGVNSKSIIKTNASGDGGIDGIVHLDPLGLDKIYLQAKRWGQNNSVGRPEIQGFFGALAGRKAQKGVFITTSRFTSEAINFAETVSDALVLVDGAKLAALMIEFQVGVSNRKVITIPEIDSDYFE